MPPLVQKIKITLSELFRSPGSTTARICRKLFSLFKKGQLDRLREKTSQAPLVLQIETTNICNAACIFCAYPGMKRGKGVMSMPLFEGIVKEYAEMGGSTISLTPVVGDALLDPHLLARLGILKAHPAIGQISVTTNGIALDRYSDKEVRYLLDAFYSIQVSIGGLDPESYQAMYGVDQFARVEQALERLVELRSSGSKGAHLTFAFRTADWKSLDPFKKQLQRYRRQGVFVSHMWTYANYGGQVASSGKVGLTILENPANKRKCCIYPRIHSAVCWDGTVTACSCTDLECAQLKIGKVGVSPLSEILAGKRRAGILNSFEKGTLADICTKCSAYRSDASGALSFFSDVHTNKPLPLDFFHEMMT